MSMAWRISPTWDVSQRLAPLTGPVRIVDLAPEDEGSPVKMCDRLGVRLVTREEYLDAVRDGLLPFPGFPIAVADLWYDRRCKTLRHGFLINALLDLRPPWADDCWEWRYRRVRRGFTGRYWHFAVAPCAPLASAA